MEEKTIEWVCPYCGQKTVQAMRDTIDYLSCIFYCIACEKEIDSIIKGE